MSRSPGVVVGVLVVATAAAAVTLSASGPAGATAADVTGGQDPVELDGEPVDLVGEPVPLFGEVASMYGETDGLTVVDTPEGTEVRTAADILFAFDSADLGDDAQAVLDEAAELLAAATPATVVVEGHTDGIGTPAYNADLSLERAERVAERLSQHPDLAGISFEPVGRGADEPIAAETDDEGEDLPEARARNRRVTLLFDG